MSSLSVSGHVRAETSDETFISAMRLPGRLETTGRMVSVIPGEQLRERGASDLRSALQLVAGLDVSPVGDGGPLGAVPGMWGLKEADAYLLVVDGVPYGGAFNPAVVALDLNNVERIEVVRGSAPVMYGSTSFVGVIHVIHAEAGAAQPEVRAKLGSPGLHALGVTVNLGEGTVARQSFSATLDESNLAGSDTGYRRALLGYRLATDIAGGVLDGTLAYQGVQQRPGSPQPREGTVLTKRMPVGANVNPADSRQDNGRVQVNVGYERPVADGEWQSRVALAHTHGSTIKGFLRSDFATDGVTINADGFNQRTTIDELYLDSHVSLALGSSLSMAAGFDATLGHAGESGGNFEYPVLPNGGNRPFSTGRNVDESQYLRIGRQFVGVYSELRWRHAAGSELSVGLRWNHTHETRAALTVAQGATPGSEEADARTVSRLGGTASLSQRLGARGAVVAFANYSSSFKPAAADLGPEAEVDILQPESGQEASVGLRGASSEGAFAWEASLFDMTMRNVVVPENVDGLPALANGGRERLRGTELEGRWQALPALRVEASYAYHDARFVDYLRLQADGSLQQLAGRRIELAPAALASLGVTVLPATGLQVSLWVAYSGSRALNKTNTVVAGAYATIDAAVGYARGKWLFQAQMRNASDRRDPVAESELGDAQYYLLPGRSAFLAVTRRF